MTHSILSSSTLSPDGPQSPRRQMDLSSNSHWALTSPMALVLSSKGAKGASLIGLRACPPLEHEGSGTESISKPRLPILALWDSHPTPL